MNNWWLSALEHFGLVTHDEALHIASEIKNSIHKEDYQATLDEFETILDKKKNLGSTTFTKLEADVADLRSELAKLKAEKKPIASPKQV